MSSKIQTVNVIKPFLTSRARTDRSSSRTAGWIKTVAALILGLLVLTSIYLLSLESPIDMYRRLLALIIFWMGVIPTFVYLLDPHRPPIPFFPLVGMFYSTNFGLPVLLANNQSEDTDNVFVITDVSTLSLWLTIIGLCCLIIGFYVGSRLLWRRRRGLRLNTNWDTSSFKMMLWACLAVYCIYRMLPFLHSIPSLSHAVNPLGYLSFGVFFFLQQKHRLNKAESIFLWGVLVPAEMLLRFSSGLIAEGMTFGLFFCLISFRTAPRLAVGMLIFCFASFAVLNPIKTQFRIITWYNTTESGGGVQQVYAKCSLLVQLTYDYYFGSSNLADSRIPKQDLLTVIASRMSSVTVLSLVVHDTPNSVPYWKGETYLPLFTKFIPRALWPGKPIENTGSEFGHRYFLLDADDDVTSINMPWIVEMYANFGRWGLFVGMGIAGVLLSWLDRMMNRAGCSSLEMVVGATILLQLVYQESSFTLVMGEAMLMFIVLRIALFFMFLPQRRVVRKFAGS